MDQNVAQSVLISKKKKMGVIGDIGGEDNEFDLGKEYEVPMRHLGGGVREGVG